MKLNLTQKGLVVIGIPLVMQILFFSTFAVLLQQSESMLRRQYHTKEVYGHANWLYTLMAVGSLAAVAASVSKDKDYASIYAVCVTRIQNELAGLRVTLSNDRLQSTQLARASALWQQSQDILQGLVSSKAQDEAEHLTQLEAAATDLKKIWLNLKDSRHELLLQERTDTTTIASPLKRRTFLRDAIFVGLVLSIVSALVMFFFYANRIIRRLEVLTENSNRLKSDKALLPKLEGGDEISNLDETFHSMAEALTAAKLQLKRDEQRLFSIIETMPIGLATLDANGNLDFANSSLRMILDTEKFSDTKPNLRDILPLELAQVENLINQNAKTEVPTSAHNSQITVEVSARTVDIAEETRKLLMVQDVTERHELEQRKQEFVAVVSHDLRTPLTSMLAYLSMMERGAYGDLNEKGLKRTDAIRRDIDRLMNLVTNILDIERMQSGKLSYLFADLPLQSVFDQSLNAVHELSIAKNILLNSTPTNLEIHGDLDRLVQVVVNLLSNAIKFAKSSVTMRATADIDMITVEIEDDGRGVPLEAQSLIFERYRQVSNADQRTGTGLGLPICKAIIEQHGGRIGVRSAGDGTGSCFFFSLPQSKSKLLDG